MTSSNQQTQSSKGDDQGGIQKGKSGRGFAVMAPNRQRALASEGGKAAHLSGNAHEFTTEEARKAGRKGGQANNSATRA